MVEYDSRLSGFVDFMTPHLVVGLMTRTILQFNTINSHQMSTEVEHQLRSSRKHEKCASKRDFAHILNWMITYALF